MAENMDMFNLSQVGNLPPELYAQQQQLNRQQQLATMLMQQGQQQPQGQMVSGRYVAPSFFQYLAPLANTYLGMQKQEQGDAKAAELAQALRTGRNATEESIVNSLTPQPEQVTELAGPFTKKIAQPIAYKPPTEPNYPEALKTIRTNPYGAGKEYLPQILKNMLPEATTEMQNFNYGEKNPQFNERQDQLKLLGRNLTTMNMPPVESAYNAAFGKGIAEQDLSLKNIAEGAKATVGNIGRQKEILESGNFFSGKAANVQNELANFGTALGVVGKNGQEKAANTQSLISGGAGITLDSIKGSGLGAGQGFTDKDLRFLEDAKSFKITFNKENIARVLDLQEKAAIEGAKKWNSRQSSIQKSATVPINVGQIDVPTPYSGKVKFLGVESK
jgi:hypothetical protein